MENLANGQKVAKYSFEAYVDGAWQPLMPTNHFNNPEPYPQNPGFETVGHKKIDRVEPIMTNRIRFCCLEAVAEPVELRSISVHHCAPLTTKT